MIDFIGVFLIVVCVVFYFLYMKKLAPGNIEIDVHDIDGLNDYDLSYLNYGKAYALKVILYYLAKSGHIKMFLKEEYIRIVHFDSSGLDKYKKAVLDGIIAKSKSEQENSFSIVELSMDEEMDKKLENLFCTQRKSWVDRNWILSASVLDTYRMLKFGLICAIIILMLLFSAMMIFPALIMLVSLIGICCIYFRKLKPQNSKLTEVLEVIRKDANVLRISNPAFKEVVITGHVFPHAMRL